MISDRTPLVFGPSDRLTLAPGITIEGEDLVDTYSGRRHPLNSTAVTIATALDGKTPVRDIIAGLAAAHDLTDDVAAHDTVTFLDDLDRIAALRLERSWDDRRSGVRAGATALVRSRGLSVLQSPWVTGEFRKPARRYPASLSGVVRACVRAHGLIMLGGFGLSMALAVMVVFAGPAMTADDWVAWSALVVSPIAMALVHMVLLVVHEGGHLLATRGRGRPHYVSVRGLSVGVTHSGSSDRSARLISAAGPLAAMVVGLAMSVAMVSSWRLGSIAPQVAATFPGMRASRTSPACHPGVRTAGVCGDVRPCWRALARCHHEAGGT